MKTAFILAGASVLSLAAPAQAQDSGAPVAVQAAFRGAALPGCRMSTPAADAIQNATLSNAAPGSADVGISRLVGDDGAVLGATVVLKIPVICNQAHTLVLSSLRGGLRAGQPGPDGGAFRSLVPYGIRVEWAGASGDFDSAGGDAVLPVGNAAQGSLNVIIDIPAGGAPLVAGAYSDELVLELSAAG